MAIEPATSKSLHISSWVGLGLGVALAIGGMDMEQSNW